MSIVNEVIVTGRIKRRLIDKAAKLWQRISYWTKACDVEFDDGKSAQEKLGNINGITSDINEESENIAASIKAVNRLNNENSKKYISNIYVGTGGKLHTVKGGADTALNFSNVKIKYVASSDVSFRIQNNTTNRAIIEEVESSCASVSDNIITMKKNGTLKYFIRLTVLYGGEFHFYKNGVDVVPPVKNHSVNWKGQISVNQGDTLYITGKWLDSESDNIPFEVLIFFLLTEK